MSLLSQLFFAVPRLSFSKTNNPTLPTLHMLFSDHLPLWPSHPSRSQCPSSYTSTTPGATKQGTQQNTLSNVATEDTWFLLREKTADTGYWLSFAWCCTYCMHKLVVANILLTLLGSKLKYYTQIIDWSACTQARNWYLNVFGSSLQYISHGHPRV